MFNKSAISDAIGLSVREVFQTLFNEEPEMLPLAQGHFPKEPDLVASIGMSGNIGASMTMIFPNSTALKLVSKMLGMSLTEVNQDVSDGIGEVLNIVAGRIKNNLHNLKCQISLSIPAVMMGITDPLLVQLKTSQNLTFFIKAQDSVMSLHFFYQDPGDVPALDPDSVTSSHLHAASNGVQAEEVLKRLMNQPRKEQPS